MVRCFIRNGGFVKPNLGLGAQPEAVLSMGPRGQVQGPSVITDFALAPRGRFPL
jgi:hypothetical protein